VYASLGSDWKEGDPPPLTRWTPMEGHIVMHDPAAEGEAVIMHTWEAALLWHAATIAREVRGALLSELKYTAGAGESLGSATKGCQRVSLTP
jgi:hypothetical protein